MFILGANSAGLLNKKESFLRNVSLFNPGVFFIQESKVRSKNKLVINDYVPFELIRKSFGGGGLLTALHKSLKPVSVSNEDEEEILVVEANLSESRVRFINGYGPQEKAPEENRKSFYNQLDLEVKKSRVAGALICMEMDSNAKLGPNIIPGKLFEKVIKENDLLIKLVE
jgi:exonuclease III